jgi:hypothetical protein
MPLPPVKAWSSGQRRDALGDEVHTEDEEQQRHHGIVVHGEPFLHQVELRLRVIPERGWLAVPVQAGESAGACWMWVRACACYC